MADVTYYFNTYDVGVNEWATNPENMVDGSTATKASTAVNNDLETLLTNDCPGTNLGTITKVELRVFGNISGGASSMTLTPVFGGTLDGDVHAISMPFSGGWTAYTDITTDTNAPGTWAWSDVVGLDCKAIAIINGGSVLCGKVDILVTYTPITPGASCCLLTKH